MTLKKITTIFIATFCTICIAQPSFANPVKLKTAWVVGQEAFAVWYAKKQGWDKELGLDINIEIYQAGKDALQDFSVNNWFIGGLGALPTVLGATDGNMSVIGVAGNEARANAIMVREDSPILKDKGINTYYPEVYGSRLSVRGKTILVSKASSVHYTLYMWLKALNLTEKDVKIQNLAQEFALLSFSHGRGDAVGLWAPYTFAGAENNWKTVATAKEVNAELPIFLVANTAFAEQHPIVTKNFLAMYMRGVQWVLDTPRKEVVRELQKYYKEVFHQDYSEDMVDLQFNVFELFDLKKQKNLLAITNGLSTARKWQNDIFAFFASEGLLTKTDENKIKESTYIIPTYMDMVMSKDIR